MTVQVKKQTGKATFTSERGSKPEYLEREQKKKKTAASLTSIGYHLSLEAKLPPAWTGTELSTLSIAANCF